MATSGIGPMAALEVTLTMTPCPCLRMDGMIARQMAKTPKVLVSKISRTTHRRRLDGRGQADTGIVHQHVDRPKRAMPAAIA